jgi:hypothetical protein
MNDYAILLMSMAFSIIIAASGYAVFWSVYEILGGL